MVERRGTLVPIQSLCDVDRTLLGSGRAIRRLTKPESDSFMEPFMEYEQTSVLTPLRLPERLPATLPDAS